MKDKNNKLITGSLLNNQILGAVLIFSYCVVYGITAQVVLDGMKLFFFISSLLFALSIFYVRDPDIQKEKIKKGVLFNQILGSVLLLAYLIVYGVSSILLLNGFQLIFFMSSYAFALSIFYIRDPERIEKAAEAISTSITGNGFFAERHPCFLNNNDLSWLVRELNGSLCTIIGFCELMLKREYGDREKEFMLRNIYDRAIAMSYSINKAAALITDSLVKPKETHEVVDLLSDKNFK